MCAWELDTFPNDGKGRVTLRHPCSNNTACLAKMLYLLRKAYGEWPKPHTMVDGSRQLHTGGWDDDSSAGHQFCLSLGIHAATLPNAWRLVSHLISTHQWNMVGESAFRSLVRNDFVPLSYERPDGPYLVSSERYGLVLVARSAGRG